MGTKHTPGPWYLTGRDDGPGEYHMHIAAPNSPMALASMNHCHTESRANARLIAAAPELLEAAHALQSALARAVGNFELAVRGKPIRDMAECLGEARHATEKFDAVIAKAQ